MEDRIAKLEQRIAQLEAWRTAQDLTMVRFLSPGNIALAQAYTRSAVLTIGGQTAEIPILR